MQLMKAEGDRKGLQHQVSQISKQLLNHQDEQGDDWRFRRGIILIWKSVFFLKKFFLNTSHFQSCIFLHCALVILFLDLLSGFSIS